MVYIFHLQKYVVFMKTKLSADASVAGSQLSLVALSTVAYNYHLKDLTPVLFRAS